jgi:hypothetical protein
VSCGTQVFVYVVVHVMCLCVYVSMVCQQCMLYDDMYSHDKKKGEQELNRNEPDPCVEKKWKGE